jgi:hypothetical protein
VQIWNLCSPTSWPDWFYMWGNYRLCQCDVRDHKSLMAELVSIELRD